MSPSRPDTRPIRRAAIQRALGHHRGGPPADTLTAIAMRIAATARHYRGRPRPLGHTRHARVIGPAAGLGLRRPCPPHPIPYAAADYLAARAHRARLATTPHTTADMVAALNREHWLWLRVGWMRAAAEDTRRRRRRCGSCDEPLRRRQRFYCSVPCAQAAAVGTDLYAAAHAARVDS